MLTREHCLAADASDELAGLRQQFRLPQDVIYLDGNSLGVLPQAAEERSLQVLRAEWGEGLIRSWNTAGWFDLPRRLGNKLGQLLGAAENEVVVTDTTSLNIFKALAAAMRIQQSAAPQRKVIVSSGTTSPPTST
jgi:kynureninase